jgi:regulator of PEP synthase PpsR (kinase-PPPase family)
VRRPDDHGMPVRRTVFFVSDRTGITAEMLGNSLLSQFEEIEFARLTIPFVDSPEKVASVIEQINDTAAREGRSAIVFSSIVDDAMSETLRQSTNALALDLFQVFIAPLETELGAKSSHAAGRSHGIANSHEYFARMDAINFTQAHDDGAETRELDRAQVILVGVSRCGKTPTSLYLAVQFGIRAANFPLTPDDFPRALPRLVLPHKDRLFGLTINGSVAQDSRRAPPSSQYCRWQLPLQRARCTCSARRNPHARYDGQVDRGDSDHDRLSRQAAPQRLLKRLRMSSPIT